MSAIDHNLTSRVDGCRNLRPGAIGVFLRAGPERLREWVLHRQLNLVIF